MSCSYEKDCKTQQPCGLAIVEGQNHHIMCIIKLVQFELSISPPYFAVSTIISDLESRSVASSSQMSIYCTNKNSAPCRFIPYELTISHTICA